MANAGDLEPEELWALERFAEGWSRDDIAMHLGVGPRAAEATLTAACRRLGARSRPHAATLLVVLRRLGAGEAEGEAV